ncbi:hypothetical protein EUGRSUZ_L01606 [Eucalyptus grandis]|uniref:Uncharacterized protein n=1 Tax=Eucalyptus grandis TaxID=71139 RepID=A0A058ZTS0_EUCGR|nr:hypothetical protein EUGRSUZ_L01606 [Eucalyptus grandis]
MHSRNETKPKHLRFSLNLWWKHSIDVSKLCVHIGEETEFLTPWYSCKCWQPCKTFSNISRHLKGTRGTAETGAKARCRGP